MLMTARMTHPVFVLDGAMNALNAVNTSITRARLPIPRELVHLRASQISGCSVCVDMHAKAARQSGESEERVHAVGAWRDTPHFTDAERAARSPRPCPASPTRPSPSPTPSGTPPPSTSTAGARRARPRHREHQPPEPPQRRHPADGRRARRVSAGLAQPSSWSKN
jgi:AhpD family alkylhydroperoxidase